MSLTLTHKEKVASWQKELEKASVKEVLAFARKEFGPKLAFATSLSAEDMVLLDYLRKEYPECFVFTLDTGRLPQETYDLLDRIRKEWHFPIALFFPNWQEVEEMVKEHGVNLFYESLEKRKLCCRIRKIEPLKRALKHASAWMTGLTRYQAITREKAKKIEWDEAFQLVKINPLVDFQQEQIWAYIRENNIPYNALHDQNYPSIGCAPCTRAIKEGEDIRAGRWWWEKPEHKECGLHLQPQ